MTDIATDVVLHGLAVPAPEATDPAYPMERIGSEKTPHRKAIQATVLVVVPAETATGTGNAPAELAGMGAIDAETARQVTAHTRHDDLQVLCRKSHQLEEEGYFDVETHPDGTIRWRDNGAAIASPDQHSRCRHAHPPHSPTTHHSEPRTSGRRSARRFAQTQSTVRLHAVFSQVDPT